VINTNLPPILHRFRDIAVDRSKIAIFLTDRPTDHATRSVTIGRIYVRSTAMRPNNNSTTMFTVLSSWPWSLIRVHPVHLMNADWAPWPLTLRPSQPTWAVSPPINSCYHPHPQPPFVITTQPESWYSFYPPTEGGRLSRPRHCRKGVQPMPKTVQCTSQWLFMTGRGLSHRSQ